MDDIGVICHDAGGSEIISHWVNTEVKNYTFKFYLEGPAETIFKRNLDFNILNKNDDQIEKFISKNSVILCGTSWQSSLEKNAMRAAKKLNKKTIVVLDHWVNYQERFLINEKDIFTPDEIWVCDEYAKKLAESFFDKNIIKHKDNYYIEHVRKEIKEFKKEDSDEVADKILYVCEPVKVHAKLKTGNENFHGYTEETALQYFLDNLHYLKENGQDIVVRPHPSEPLEKYDWVLNYYNGSICIGGHKSLLEEILSANLVVGCESMAMIIALTADKKVVSSIPPGGRKCRLPHKEIKMLQNYIKSSSPSRVRF